MELLSQIGQWSGYVLWSLLLVIASLLVYLGLGGNFVLVGLALIHALITGFDPLTWRFLLVILGLALFGEAVEFVVGTFYVAKKGATKSGMIWAFVGGIAGAAVGNSAVPVIGAVLGSFVGAFAGAVFGEYRRQARLEPSLRIGGHAFLGRILAIALKHGIALVIVFLILRRTLPD